MSQPHLQSYRYRNQTLQRLRQTLACIDLILLCYLRYRYQLRIVKTYREWY